MKSVLFLILLIVVPITSRAQVQVRPLPARGYEQRIIDFINDMKVVDTHEHLLSLTRLKQRTTLDFMLLLQHYSADDIKSAGMPSKLFAKLLKDSLTVRQKWDILEPFWESSKNTAYNRAALLAADKLFGISDINESTVEALSEKINKAYQTDWVSHVVNDKCKIEYLIQDSDDRSFGTKGFRYAVRFDNFIFVNSKQQISSIAKRQNTSIVTLDDFIKALGNAFTDAKEKGIVAIKSGLAYSRILNYENSSRGSAAKVFEDLMNSPDGTSFSFAEVKPLQDFMMHRVLDLARENKLPVMIHTGLQTGNGNIIENTKPTHLVNLIMEYPTVKFVLFHGSYPYGPELTTIAKNFPNVFIDMCWLYVISPSYSERFLHEWIETVPASKILGFGGDYLNIENTFSHLLFGKQVVARVLIDKVKDGYLSESEAKNIARMILHDNAVKLYNLSQ
jgi:predicted TIM-barrel fold metal-dependent hydrolase